MRKIIDKKAYDTEKATCLTSWTNGLFFNEFDYLAETLYITQRGSFFLYGEGGACTKYAHHYAGKTTKGESIIPLSKQELYEWLEENGEIELIEEYFSDEIKDA